MGTSGSGEMEEKSSFLQIFIMELNILWYSSIESQTLCSVLNDINLLLQGYDSGNIND